MKENKIELTTVDAYIAQFEEHTRLKLMELRKAIREAAPDASEKIAWSMPLYSQNGFLIQFAAHKKHIGFYCSPAAITFFKEELRNYKTNLKNTIQFPLDKDLPLDLIKRIVLFRIDENMK